VVGVEGGVGWGVCGWGGWLDWRWGVGTVDSVRRVWKWGAVRDDRLRVVVYAVVVCQFRTVGAALRTMMMVLHRRYVRC